MRRFAVASLSLAVVAGALVFGAALATNASAATCTGTVQVVSMTFNPPTVVAGQSSTATLKVQNCTNQQQVLNIQFYARFLGSSNGIPPGCIVYDPLVRQLTVPASANASIAMGYSTFAGCTATGLQATATISLGGTTLGSQDAILNILGPSASVSPSASPSTRPASCAVNYVRSSEWAGGVVAQVTISNTGTAPISGWTLGFTFPGDQKITNAWNATVTQTGAAVSAANASYNPTIPAGGSVSFGFQASWHTSDANPMAFVLNQAACTTLFPPPGQSA
jgi:hypothetical protein